MTQERYSRLFDLVTAGAGHLAVEGDETATRDAGELMSELARELPWEESNCLISGMLDSKCAKGAFAEAAS